MNSLLSEFITKVTKPSIEKARRQRSGQPTTRLRPDTLAQYRTATRHLIGDFAETHRHQRAFTGYSVADGTAYPVLRDCLQEIARLHGSEAARQAKTVLSKYVIGELIDSN